jgi:hypothetical protein
MSKTRNSWLLPPSIVNDAPRTIGRSGFLKADDGRKHTKDEREKYQGLHAAGRGIRNLGRTSVRTLRFPSALKIGDLATGIGGLDLLGWGSGRRSNPQTEALPASHETWKARRIALKLARNV